MALTKTEVAGGGTGATSLTDHGVLLGSGSGAVSATGAGTTGQVLTSGGSGADPDWADAAGGGLSYVDSWRMSANFSNSGTTIIAANLERVDTDGFAAKGTGMAVNSSTGVWTFPATGWWLIKYKWAGSPYGAGNTSHSQRIETTTDAASSWVLSDHTDIALDDGYQDTEVSSIIFKVDAVDSEYVRFTSNMANNTGTTTGNTDKNQTAFQFIHLADL